MPVEQPKFGHFLEKPEQDNKEDYKKLLIEFLVGVRIVSGALIDIWIKRPLREKMTSKSVVKSPNYGIDTQGGTKLN